MWLVNQYLVFNLMLEYRKWHYRASGFQNLPGEQAPTPLFGGGALGPLKLIHGVCYLLQNLLKPLAWCLALLHLPCTIDLTLNALAIIMFTMHPILSCCSNGVKLNLKIHLCED